MRADPLPGTKGEQKKGAAHGASRLVTFFGMIPNFEPHQAVSVLNSLIRPGDILIASANLMPAGASAAAHVLSQYNNELTREWLGHIEDYRRAQDAEEAGRGV